VIVVSYAPQIEVLRRSSLCITHAGLNTVLESLSNAVPMLALPITNDQPGVAARIANKKSGVVISPDQASPGTFVAAIKRCSEIPRSGITFRECRKQSEARTVFRSPQVFLNEHLSWKRGSRAGLTSPPNALRIECRINRGGEKIGPREIDEVLLSHPAVAEAVCFGIPHPAWGEEVAAAVVLKDAASEAEIVAFCKERLAEFKRPKKFLSRRQFRVRRPARYSAEW